MKTRLLATGLLLAMNSVVFADRSLGHPPGFNIEKLEVLLDLDAYQKSELQKILDERRDAMRPKREELRNPRRAPRSNRCTRSTTLRRRPHVLS